MVCTKHIVCKASKKHFVVVPDFVTGVMKKRHQFPSAMYPKRSFHSGNVKCKVYPKSTKPSKNSGVERVMELVKALNNVSCK